MGKASSRRKRRNHLRLRMMFDQDRRSFEHALNNRIDCWLYEIRLAAEEWKRGGDAARESIYSIVDSAMEFLFECGNCIYKIYAEKTFNILAHECCAQIAGITDSRLYRLSNMTELERHAKKARIKSSKKFIHAAANISI